LAEVVPEPRPQTGAITAPRGFVATGVHAGIRRKRLDLALIVSEAPATAAAVFTRNLAAAAPVQVSREHLSQTGGVTRAIVVNAGNANACTGEAGLEAARRTAACLALHLDVPVAQILVASTGVIGQPLPLPRLLDAMPSAVASLSLRGGADAATAILTTDTCEKEALRVVNGRSGAYRLGGMAKGSGMIHPDMATTLAFVTTDARVPAALLQRCLQRATDVSFNRISVDGDTSTNDCIVLLANGASGVQIDLAHPRRLRHFEEALTDLLTDLAIQVVRDGEGATKVITIRVHGAANEAAALQVARTVAASPLVKTAVHGADANWGRVVAAACRAGVMLDPERLHVRFGDVSVLQPGFRADASEEAARHALEGPEVTIDIDLGSGLAEAVVWTCDLTSGYVEINANYRT
jgi:glutamate N-acetyltransferase/amino-acid N-acetyltransferase